jgi:phytanoyl-CoA hydroxylase
MHDAVRKFHEDGCVVVRGVFPRETVAEILERIETFAREHGPSLPPGRIYYESNGDGLLKALHRPELDDPWLERLQSDPRLLSIVGAVFPEAEVLPTGTSFFAKLAGAGSETPPHQDNVFQHHKPPLALTATIALDGSDQSNGPLICLRGSHRLGVLPHRQSDVMGFSQTLIDVPSIAEYPEIILTMEPGDVSLHHVNTVHYSHGNRTPRHRRQYGLGYRSSLAMRDEEGYRLYRERLDEFHARAKG